MYRNIVITAANDLYFESLKTLISSIHQHSFDTVDQIFVYDLNLDEENKTILKKIQKVTLLNFTSLSPLPYKDYLLPSGHAYKLFCVYDAQNYGNNVLWLDAGVMLLKDIKEMFDIIEKEEIFVVGDVHLTCTFTKKKCREIMNATDGELNDTIISSGILGYKSQGKYQSLINEAFEYSKIEGCVVGDEENHRHDQSVYSILVSRYNCKKQDIDRYGYWTDFTRTLQTAMQNDAVIFVHRRGHYDISNLRYNT